MLNYLTGANGFIGKAVRKYIEGSGDEAIDIGRDGKGCFSKEGRLIYLAAYGNHYNQKDIDQTVYANLTYLKRLVEIAHSCGVKDFWNISSSSVTLSNITPYSASKYLGEQIVSKYGYRNIRPYSVYGPGEADHRFIPTVIRSLKSGEKMKVDENATHDWIFIDDFVQAMFNGHNEIGTGVKTTNLEVVYMLQEISGKKLNYDPVENMRSYDNKNWVCPNGVPSIGLYEGLKRTYESSR